MEPETNTANTSSQTHGMGPLVATLIVLAVLVLGGVYFLNSRANAPQNTPPVILGDDNANAGLPPTSSSDEVSSIEADLNATDLNEMEAQINTDLQTIDANL